jgi:hypothetical protein
MKLFILFIPALLLLSLSCRNKKSSGTNNVSTPTALQENTSSGLLKKRAKGDLVDNLYDELVENTPELKDLETQIDDFNSRKPDSLANFVNYDNKSNDYYNSARSHYNQIQDSVIKEKISSLITKSQITYDGKTADIKFLIKKLKEKTITLDDLHIVLKLSRTLPVIEKYQTDNLPSPEPIKAVVNDIESLIKKVDTLSKKQ